ncbi:hypothetical protein XI03_07805 [Bradyrhizobium sp. CCBAU 65884]|nr:hypothetical protein [Bradyrhizobium sp. CCBAU 65884]
MISRSLGASETQLELIVAVYGVAFEICLPAVDHRVLETLVGESAADHHVMIATAGRTGAEE